ncbi:hypothetical protein ACOMHN_032871 [Nucella lapillus]
MSDSCGQPGVQCSQSMTLRQCQSAVGAASKAVKPHSPSFICRQWPSLSLALPVIAWSGAVLQSSMD